MKTVHVLATVFLVAAINLESGYGIKCFVCKSYRKPYCEDTFNFTMNTVTQCKPEYDICEKIVQEIKIDGFWEVTYVRQCAKSDFFHPKDYSLGCREDEGYVTKLINCNCDSSDGCNSATSWNLPLTLLAGALAGQYFWHKL